MKNNLATYKIGYFPGDGWYGMQYRGIGMPEFTELLKFATTILSEILKNQLPDSAIEVIEALKSSLSDFEDLITVTRSGSNKFIEVPILKYIPPDEFVKTIIKMHNSDLRYIGDILLKRYSSNDIRKELIDELEWIQHIKELLSNQQSIRSGKVSGLLIEGLISKLDKIIENLQHLN